METTIPRREPMQLIPARLPPEDHLAITVLARKHGRRVGEEYRTAIAAWIKQHEADLQERDAA